MLTHDRNLEPGGFIELQDSIYPITCDDDTMPEDSAIRRWSTLVNEAFRLNGRPLDTALHYEKQLADAGFVNIHVVRDKLPINRWPKSQKYKQLGMNPANSRFSPIAPSPLYPDFYIWE